MSNRVGAVDRAVELLGASRSERVSAIFDFDPWDYQADVLDSPYKRRLWVCGRQVGKTETAGVIPADWVLTHPGEDALVVAEYQETADELFERTKDHFEAAGTAGEVGIDTPNKTSYELDTGSRVLSRTIGGGSGEEKGAKQRGKVPSCIVVEEASMPPKSVYDQVLRPMFATHDDYLMVLISTPRGKNGYLWKKWNEAPGSDRWERFHNKTADNPLVTDEWLAEERGEVDELTWKQEYLGEFIETGEEYIPESLYRRVQDTRGVGSIEPEDGPLYLALDPARSGEDRSVYTAIDSTGTVFYLNAYDTERSTDSVRRLKQLNSEYGFRRIYIDDSSGGVVDYAKQDLSNVRGYRFTLKNKADMYQGLKSAFENREIRVPDNDSSEEAGRLRDETTSLTFGYSQNEILQVSHPPGGHDDYPDSLALCWKAKSDAEQRINRSPVQQRDNPPGLHSRNRRADNDAKITR